VHLTGYPNQDDFPDMTSDQVLTAVTGAANAWSSVSQSCTFLTIDVSLSSAAAPSAIADMKSSLIFRHQDWCSPTDTPWTCSYDPSALAITSVFVQRSTGRIQEADIEVNDRWFGWTDLDLFPQDTTKQDLQNALTHEMGHLIGLDHTCYTAGTNTTRPKDNNGNPVPDCANAPPEVQATTMFASAKPGDVSKRTLEADDKQAVCDVYPLANDPAYCPAATAAAVEPSKPFGCAVAPAEGTTGARATAGLLTLAATALVLRRRQRAGRAPR
jgi:MYXO-CTERM domain-containing protein